MTALVLVAAMRLAFMVRWTFQRALPRADALLFREPTRDGGSACADCPARLLPPWVRLDGARLDDAPLRKPCGARPRSVAFPCADQVRDPLLLPGRFAD